MDINDAVNVHAPSLMQIPGVVGVAVSEDDNRPCILVLVNNQTALVKGVLPESLEGYPVVGRVTGIIRPLDTDS